MSIKPIGNLERIRLNRFLLKYGLRVCNICCEPCELEEFYLRGTGSYSSKCKRCSKICGRVWNAVNKDRHAETTRKWRHKKQGIPEPGYW